MIEREGDSSSNDASYRGLIRTPNFARLICGVTLVRLGGGILELTVILFTLDRWHSSKLTGLVVLIGWLPGVLASPFAGALLDRKRRIPLVVFDHCVGAVASFTTVGFAVAGLLRPWLLILIISLSSLPVALGDSGVRTLLAVIPRPWLWDRANALDSAIASAAVAVGPVIAGGLVGIGGGYVGFIALGALNIIAVAVLIRVKEPSPRRTESGRVFSNVWSSVRLVAKNAALRSMALTIFIDNVGLGVLQVALPVWVYRQYSGNDLIVGAAWSVFNAASVGSSLLIGRSGTRDKERKIMSMALVAQTIGFVLVVTSPNAWLIVGFMAVAGLAIGPLDISMFSFQQRLIKGDRLGGVNAVSMTFTSAGTPIGAAVSGFVLAWSTEATLVLVPVLAVVSAGLSFLLPRINRSPR